MELKGLTPKTFMKDTGTQGPC